MLKRELDGYYFRMQRDGKWTNVCFSDMTEDEMHSVLARFDKDALERMCIGLGQTIRQIGDQFDLMAGYAEDAKY